MALLVIVEIDDITQVIANLPETLDALTLIAGLESSKPAFDEIISFSLYKFFCQKSCHSQTAKNVGARSGLVLSLFEGLFLRTLGKQGLEFGYGSINRPVILWAKLIHLSEDGGKLEAINRFFRLVCPNCLVLFRNILSEPQSKVDVLLKRIEWGRALLILCHHLTW